MKWQLTALLLLLGTADGLADGSTVRLAERQGAYRITVFTSPQPLRAGPVDISVLVQDADSGQPVEEVDITLALQHMDQPALSLTAAAIPGGATNQLLRAAQLELPAAGRWRVQVSLAGPSGPAASTFEVEVLEALPRWTQLVCWIAWPALAVLAFAVQQAVMRRTTQQRPVTR